VTTLRAFFDRHPRLALWIALAVGMVIMMLWAAQGKGLAPGQIAFLGAACVGVAGACAWIISWE